MDDKHCVYAFLCSIYAVFMQYLILFTFYITSPNFPLPHKLKMLKKDYSDEVKDSRYAFLIIKQQQTSFVLRLHYDKCLFFEFKFLPIRDVLYTGDLIA